MKEVIGGDTYAIKAPQSRNHLTFVVSVVEQTSRLKFDSLNIRFFNSDGSPIKIDFSDLDISLLFDPDTEQTSLGEFEYVKTIDGGFEIFGDFGIIWVYCDKCSPEL